MVVQWPWTSGVEPLRHDHESGSDANAVGGRVRAELLVQRVLPRFDGELRCEDSPAPEALVKDALAQTAIEPPQLGHGHPAGKRRGNNGAGRRPPDKVEVVGETEVVP